ncbi:YhgE/Pip domain-containing protein [Corynebacterium timonense]|uniref:Putative membrane protein n=1 Tax=Corynebacterium timonense TaxID=441500 RepID=A0A1H1PSB6_9CORY|nr:YhgE/Pip domain-containing protein [Corynebacterium timonense]SDS13983.1 putative membrane protein [Corynebacterium timonense]
MRQSGQILSRDIRRLVRVPRAFIIILGVLITPALYAWFNINAFWDPYSNTENIRIVVVNQDRGAVIEGDGADEEDREIDVGKQISEQLEENDTIGWEFLPEDEARDALMRGEYYAMFLIPPSFSEDILSLAEETYVQPTLQYYANEKINGVSPTITDASASVIDSTIATTFKQQVAEAAASELRDAGLELRHDTNTARDNATGGLEQVAQSLDSASERVQEMRSTVNGARPVVGELRNLVISVDDTLGSVGTALNDIEGLLRSLEASSADFSASASTALLESTNALSTGAASANASITSATDELKTAQARARSALREVEGVLSQGEAATAQLRSLADGAPISPAISAEIDSVISALEERTGASREIIDGLGDLDRTTGTALDSLGALGDSLEQAAGDSASNARLARDELASTVPAINAALSRLSGSVASVRGAVTSQQALTDETLVLLAGVDNQLTSSLSVLNQVSGNLVTLADGARTAQNDIATLLSTSDSETLNNVTSLNSVQIGEYIAEPVSVEQHEVFPADNYGSAMAAFFTNLALWIGAFVLTIIFRVEVDMEGFRRLTVGQAYLGRFFLFATLSALQAIVVSVGNLAFGVQMESIAAFFVTAILTGIAYTAIIYAIVSAFGHLGRGLAVLLVVIQIPGASGLYPIELMPGFFRALYPLLPFSYGINAMRETISGFYGGHYFRYMAVLFAIAALVMALGWLFRRTSSHANLLFNRQLATTNLITSEKVEVMGSPYRISDIMAALSDRKEFGEAVAKRARFLHENYKTLIFAGIGAGVIGVAIITGLTMLLPTDKSVMLAIAVAWSLLVILYLGGVEYFTQSLVDAQQVTRLGDAELRDAVVHRHDSTGTAVTIAGIPADGHEEDHHEEGERS